MGADRQRVVLIAHDVEDRGAMERSLVENVRRGMADVDFCVVSSTQEPGLRAEWNGSECSLRGDQSFSGSRPSTCWARCKSSAPVQGLRQSTGAIVPNRAEIAIITCVMPDILRTRPHDDGRALT